MQLHSLWSQSTAIFWHFIYFDLLDLLVSFTSTIKCGSIVVSVSTIRFTLFHSKNLFSSWNWHQGSARQQNFCSQVQIVSKPGHRLKSKPNEHLFAAAARYLSSSRLSLQSEGTLISSVRSSNSHPDLLVITTTTTTTTPLFQIHTGPQHWTFTFWATTAI